MDQGQKSKKSNIQNLSPKCKCRLKIFPDRSEGGFGGGYQITNLFQIIKSQNYPGEGGRGKKIMDFFHILWLFFYSDPSLRLVRIFMLGLSDLVSVCAKHIG